MSPKAKSITLLVTAEWLAMSLWFSATAVLPDMLQEATISPARQALLSSGVQAGFAIGAILVAVLGIADRFDPRRVFAISAALAAAINLVLLISPIGGTAAIVARIATGALMAGIYPVGMKIITGWGKSDRGFLVGLLVGALALGTASPHLVALIGGPDWRASVTATSVLAFASALLVLFTTLGPYHAKATRFDPAVIKLAWTDKRIRLAFAGYLGHMWELYAMWAWIGIIAATSYGVTIATDEAITLGKLSAFLAIAAGGLACVPGGAIADRIGKARLAGYALVASGTAAIATALSFGGPVWLTFALIVIWGIAVIPDSPQFSAMVADYAPPEAAGSLMTFQTSLGFSLTIVIVQVTPTLADWFGWPIILALMALGPAFGAAAMWNLRKITR